MRRYVEDKNENVEYTVANLYRVVDSACDDFMWIDRFFEHYTGGESPELENELRNMMIGIFGNQDFNDIWYACWGWMDDLKEFMEQHSDAELAEFANAYKD